MTNETVFQHGYALLIGVGADLPVTIKDAYGLKNLLTDTARCAYPKENVKLIVGEEATRSGILSGLDWLIEKVKSDPQATVTVYFSGHGGKSPNYHFVPFGYNPHDLPQTAVSGSEFSNKLKEVKAQKLLILLDCCHAGGMTTVKGVAFEKSPVPEELVDILTAGSGRVVIASSRADEKSYTGEPYSVFTQALREALAGYGASDQNGYANVADIAMYVGRVVPQETGERQHPILKLAGADSFIVAYYAGGGKAVKSIDGGMISPISSSPVDVDVDMVVGYQKILKKYQSNLLKIEEQMAEFYDQAAVPLDLQRAKAAVLNKIEEMEGKIKFGLSQFNRSMSAKAKVQFLSGVPSKPDLIVGREDNLAYLKGRLGVGGSIRSPLTVVHGLPGVGKTTTINALFYEQGIAEAFPDGVLWVALGEKSNPFSHLVDWGEALGIANVRRLPTIEKVIDQISRILYNKEVLLVIDDVWEAEDGVPFKVGGPNCAMLFTTRFPDVARQLVGKLEDDIYRLPLLTDEEGLNLLKEITPSTVLNYPEESYVLVQDLEGLPLGIKVAGRLLNKEGSMGWSVIDLIEELREGAKLLKELVPLDRRRDRADILSQTTFTVAALLKKSTDRLSDEVREHFAYLGAFAPKPATFDLSAMAAVWLVDDPKPSVRELIGRGLLEFSNGRYQLHSLLVAHAKDLLKE